jgi:molybdate transport system substrate-binding protein
MKLCTFLLLFAVTAQAQNKITVAVAANMQYTIAALKAAYYKQDKTEIQVVLGASGKLTQQIMAGAPFDILVSADTAFPARLANAGYALQPPRNYAQGLLVLWSARPDIIPTRDMRLLTGDNISHIAIANPATAPYGTAAVGVLKKYGLYDKVAAKIVQGESITQASQFIGTRTADIGFTAKAIVISAEMKGKGHWVEVSRQDYPAIKQAAVLLKNSHAAAAKFYNFLYSAEAKKIFEQFGYIVP